MGLINEEIQCEINIKSKGKDDHCLAIIGKAFFKTIDDNNINSTLLQFILNKWDEHYKEILQNIDTNNNEKKKECKNSSVIESKLKNILYKIHSAHKKDNNNKNNQKNKPKINNQENSDEDDDINDTTSTATAKATKKQRKTNEDAAAKKKKLYRNRIWYNVYNNCQMYVIYIYIYYCEFAFYVDLIIQ